MGKKRSLTIAGRYNEIRHACRFIGEAAKEAGFDQRAIFYLELACDEACTNIIEHAYGGEDVGEIVLTCQLAGDAFTITIKDNGRSFDPDTVPEPKQPHLSPSSNVDDLKVGGLGLHLMRQTMDEVNFIFDEEHGNRLIMVKRLPGATEK